MAGPTKFRPLGLPVLRQRLQLPPAQEPLLTERPDAPDYLLDRLLAQGLALEAMRFIAYALPPREAVWWGCMCVGHAAPAALADPERAALAAAEAWVRQPDGNTRRAAAWAAAAAGYEAPGAWPALGAYWSQLDKPDDLRGGRGVETAIVRALARTARSAACLADFIASGRDIAAGGAGRLAPAGS